MSGKGKGKAGRGKGKTGGEKATSKASKVRDGQSVNLTIGRNPISSMNSDLVGTHPKAT